jgi:hypothetical protein
VILSANRFLSSLHESDPAFPPSDGKMRPKHNLMTQKGSLNTQKAQLSHVMRNESTCSPFFIFWWMLVWPWDVLTRKGSLLWSLNIALNMIFKLKIVL